MRGPSRPCQARPVTLADLIPTQDGEGIWDAALGQQHEADSGELFDLFSGWAADRGLPLYPHQEEALLEIVADANVIVGTPTGSGKSLIATAALFTGLATGPVTLAMNMKPLVGSTFHKPLKRILAGAGEGAAEPGN